MLGDDIKSMREVFTSNSFVLAGSVLLLAILNWVVAVAVHRRQTSQPLMSWETPSAGLPGRIRSMPVRYALPFITATFAIAFAFAPDAWARAIFAGGYIVMQLVATAFSFGGLLILRALSQPGIATGQITYSQRYQYKHTASYLLGFSLFALAIAALSGSIEFLSGAGWMLATSAGYARRVRQVRA